MYIDSSALKPYLFQWFHRFYQSIVMFQKCKTNKIVKAIVCPKLITLKYLMDI